MVDSGLCGRMFSVLRPTADREITRERGTLSHLFSCKWNWFKQLRERETGWWQLKLVVGHIGMGRGIGARTGQ